MAQLTNNLIDLASLYGQPLEPNQLRLYAMALSDLTGAQLEKGFQVALRESKFWPRPAELREFATGVPAKGTDVQEANRYWAWATKWAPTLIEPCEYRSTLLLRDDEVSAPEAEPTTTREKIQASIREFRSLNPRCDTTGSGYDLAHAILGCIGHYDGPEVDSFFTVPGGVFLVEVQIAPPIPETLREILIQLEGSTSRALNRIAAHLESGEDKHLRHNFEEAALSVITAYKQDDATYTPAARQLTGKVDHLDKVVARSGLFQLQKTKLVPITEEWAREIHAAGTISESDVESHLWTLANLEIFSRSEYKPRKTDDDLYPRR